MFGLREWRALALGWASALILAIFHGTDWTIPVIAISMSLVVWSNWD